MKRVIIESPYAGNIARNLRYADLCLLDSLLRGEAPFASHLLYPRVLNDARSISRYLGIKAGFAWKKQAELTAFYINLGWSEGMLLALEECNKIGSPWVERKLSEKQMEGM